MAIIRTLKPFFPTPNSKPPSSLLSLSSFSTSSPSDHHPPTPISTVVAVLTHSRSKSRWSHLRSLRPDGFSPSEFSQIALHLKNNPHLALRFFLWARRNSHCPHDLTSYSTLIHILARGRLKRRALALLRDAIRAPESNPLKVFETLVKSYTECGSAPFVFDLLIEACLISKKIDSSIDIARMLISRGISPGIGTSKFLIREVCRCHGADEGYRLYEEIFVSNCGVVKPNVEILNTLMVGFYQDGDMEKVKEIWDRFSESNCDPNCYSYSILMAVCCDEGKMDEAENLWEEMKVKNLEFDVVAYNTIIGGFCRIGEVEKAEEYFREMGLSGIESSSTTFEHFVKGYCKVGNVDSAMLVYKDMLRKGFRPDGSTMEGLIGGFCEKSRGLEALEILRGAKGGFGFRPTRKSIEVLVMGLCREGKMEEALEVQRKMVSEGFEPCCEVYGAFISGYVVQGNSEMAERLRKEMLQVCG
ncbi:hypothetical protein TIFTF001_006847 [Ficus carica]|uniref:Pentatricopeptide repeat-containing protein n=1 Tax=Ficus carica TaxID=3494 RepID=A0AA88CZ34_FICCA|nr:hypothetical protein TIFTF001_006847 [Ficus carica]